MSRCDSCRYQNDFEFHACHICHMEKDMYRPKETNADRIKAMTDEELSELFADNNCGYCRIHDFCFAKGCQINCEDVWLDWLRQEAEEGE